MHINLHHICGAFGFRKNKIAQVRMELSYPRIYFVVFLTKAPLIEEGNSLLY
jgi:hypothetical protein